MRFVSMTLRNWRSFHGENSLEFSTDDNKPVTLVLGPNGAGKTALLNAFTWVIYGDFTEGFDKRDDLINQRVAALTSALANRGIAPAAVSVIWRPDAADSSIHRDGPGLQEIAKLRIN